VLLLCVLGFGVLVCWCFCVFDFLLLLCVFCVFVIVWWCVCVYVFVVFGVWVFCCVLVGFC
jgi:hypothetical protein